MYFKFGLKAFIDKIYRAMKYFVQMPFFQEFHKKKLFKFPNSKFQSVIHKKISAWTLDRGD